MMRSWLGVPLVAVAAVGALAATGAPAVAGPVQPAVVTENAADWTPNLVADATTTLPLARDAAQIGNTMYVGGKFRMVEDAARTTQYPRTHLFAFDATDGTIRSFAPSLNSDVWALEASPTALYVGGRFGMVNGVARRGVVKLDPVTGAVDPAFNARFRSGRVSDIKLVGGRLIVSGSFPGRLLALDPATGANTGYINANIQGTIDLSTDPAEVFKFAVSPDGSRLVGVGNFTSVDGVNRQRVFMLNLDTTGDTLSDWYYTPFDRRCLLSRGSRVAYLKDVDFSPDGSYFVVVSTGLAPQTPAEIGTAVCDAAARFETADLAPTVPTWINYTGGDTLHAVLVTGAAVYVQGHSRWLDNPDGFDSAGPGAVVRWGGGAIDPVTGLANDWDPVMKNTQGGYGFLATNAGLWILRDGRFFNGEYHRGIVFAPLP